MMLKEKVWVPICCTKRKKKMVISLPIANFCACMPFDLISRSKKELCVLIKHNMNFYICKLYHTSFVMLCLTDRLVIFIANKDKINVHTFIVKI